MKDVIGYEGIYKITDCGKLFSVRSNKFLSPKVDKDTLIFGNKTYSKETCLFIPLWLNVLLNSHKNGRGDFPQGVSKQYKGYQASHQVEGKSRYIGIYSSIQQASEAYHEAKIKYIESKRADIDAVGHHNGLDYSLTNIVIENFKKQTGLG